MAAAGRAAPAVLPLVTVASQANADTLANLADRHGIANTAAGWAAQLAADLHAPHLEALVPHLWLFATPAAEHVDSLHQQAIKGRVVVPAENPKLHLVWWRATVYAKPVPGYLLSAAFWAAHLRATDAGAEEQAARRRAAGLLRSYAFLVKHESDFVVAQRAGLLRADLAFDRWQAFIKPFRSLHNDDVAPRFAFGQFRHSRLTWAARGFRVAYALGLVAWPAGLAPDERVPWGYYPLRWELRQSVVHYAAPLAFVFAMLSLILSSMQVVLAALGPSTWDAFVRVSWGFSVATIFVAGLPIVLALGGAVVVFGSQLIHAVKLKWKSRGPAGGDMELQGVPAGNHAMPAAAG